MIDAMLERFRQGDRQALARVLSFLMAGRETARILAGLGRVSPTARAVAFIGSGGVGKSSLVGKLIENVRGQDKTVAVLACDPRSPVSGGALLGDRFRMPSRPDDGVFIRSIASASGEGAVPANLADLIRAVDAFGFDLIFVETVGAGQGDTPVADLVDVLVLLLQPETGDDLQWEKAGVLEIADVIVIHKADLPGAEATEAQVRSSLSLPGAHAVPIIRVSSRKGEGIASLWDAIAACPLRRALDSGAGRDLLRLAKDDLDARFARATAGAEPSLTTLIAEWQKGNLEQKTAVEELFAILLERCQSDDP